MKQLILTIIASINFVAFSTPFKASRIIDGDTFETETGEKVRLVGINAPEIRDIFGEEAAAHLAQMIEGRTVDLLPDHTSNDRDRYGRLLRYIILDGVDINKKMVLDGFAFSYLKYHFDKEEDYKQAQLTAKQKGAGIWGNGQKNEIVKQQTEETGGFFSSFSTQKYLIAGLISLLILIGIWAYFKR